MSELTRILQDGGVDGLARIGAERGHKGSREELAQLAVADIVHDWGRSGRADELLKFFGSLAAGKGSHEGGESLLLVAMKRVPGLLPDTGESPTGSIQTIEPSGIEINGERATDSKSAARVTRPIFHPQLPFFDGT